MTISANDVVVHSIDEVPVTQERIAFVPAKDSKLQHASTARANIAPSTEAPNGTTSHDWANKHSHQTVLQQHCDFFDRDHDGVLWPQDTFIGFHRLGFNILASFIAVLVIHINFSYPTQPGWLPDPCFRLFLKNVHRTKHGSDTGTYDHEGRFVPQRFEDVFAKYAAGRDYMTWGDVVKTWSGQRCAGDPVGWAGEAFEWSWTYLMLWPEDGKMKKDDIRRVYDGSIFYDIAAKREKKQ